MDRVEQWWAGRKEDFPTDAGALDLQHYFDFTYGILYTYSDSHDLLGEVTLEKRGTDWYHWSRLERTGGRDEQFKKRATSSFVAEAIDIGMLDEPVWNWETIAVRITRQQRQRLEWAIKTRGRAHVLLRYRRPGPDGIREGVLGTLVDYENGEFTVTAVETAEDNDAVLTHRAGRDYAVTSTKSALIVGVGAVGSFVADQLARSGIGQLTLLDYDRLRPGNSTRHLCGPDHIHEFKTDAVKKILVERTKLASDLVRTATASLRPELAFDLVPKHDIVINATADYGVEWMLDNIAMDLDVPAVHVGIHRHGGLIRIDRTSRHLDPSLVLDAIPALEDGAAEIREVGCIDPISPAPPHAVHAAASYATATVLDTISGRWEMPDSVVHVMGSQPDEPYRKLGSIYL